MSKPPGEKGFSPDEDGDHPLLHLLWMLALVVVVVWLWAGK